LAGGEDRTLLLLVADKSAPLPIFLLIPGARGLAPATTPAAEDEVATGLGEWYINTGSSPVVVGLPQVDASGGDPWMEFRGE
jgi:hypothetical protein